jgi:hypothetical protein
MKKILVLSAMAIALFSCGKRIKHNSNTENKTVEAGSLITPDSLCWMASAVSAPGYVAANNSIDFNDDEQHLLCMEFKNNGRFKALQYERNNVYQPGKNIAEIEGTVAYKVNDQHHYLVMHAESGHYITTANENAGNTGISKDALEILYSNTYLWEKISFPGIGSAGFLLLVDQDAHPGAGTSVKGVINKNWVSKFYLRSANAGGK